MLLILLFCSKDERPFKESPVEITITKEGIGRYRIHASKGLTTFREDSWAFTFKGARKKANELADDLNGVKDKEKKKWKYLIH